MIEYITIADNIKTTTREVGSMTKMLEELDLKPLHQRRKDLRLTFLYKIVEGLVPAVPSEDYLTPQRNKRRITERTFTDCVSTRQNRCLQ